VTAYCNNKANVVLRRGRYGNDHTDQRRTGPVHGQLVGADIGIQTGRARGQLHVCGH